MSLAGAVRRAAAERSLPPSGERVDAWLASLDPGSSEAALAWRVLSGAERARAERLQHDSTRAALARAALRVVLGHCLGITPERVRLVTGADGRPRLAPGAPVDLRFSVSRSVGFALIAVRLAHDVGADLEKVRDDVDREGVAAVVFDDRERAAMAALATRDPRGAFFRAWTRHEAMAKAAGHGLLPPDGPGEEARFTARDLPAPAGYAAAVASEGSAWRLRTRVVAPPWLRG